MNEFIRGWIFGFFRFVIGFGAYVWRRYLLAGLLKFEFVKSLAVVKMYQQRGKYAQVAMHAGMITIMLLGITLGPSLVVSDGQVRVKFNQGGKISMALASSSGSVLKEAETFEALKGKNASMTLTQVSDKPRSEVIDYKVKNGDTLGTVAAKFGVSLDTLRWANAEIKKINSIKPGEVIKIPPVTGVVHRVKSGETIYSIAKKYGTEPQAIVDFPFNDFINDETFSLAIGQTLMVPDGVMPKKKLWPSGSNFARVLTPDAGAVSATGNWIWPAKGRITQYFKSWHKAIDVANKGGGPILAADAGVVVVAGWPDNFGYGNRVMVDHKNGYKTLYAHMSSIAVKVGQRVNRGDKLGNMGSTGRSTGTHLHFEIRGRGGNLDPMRLLK